MSDSKGLFLYDPYEYGGTGLEAFNWLNATHFGWIGWDQMGKSAAPGYQTRPFEAIPDSDIGGDIVKYGWGGHLGDSTDADAKDTMWTDENYKINLARLFEPYYALNKDSSEADVKKYHGWRYEMNTFFNNPNKWYQMMGFNMYNAGDYLYPFAVKGISFKLAVPANETWYGISNSGDKYNYGDHMTIDRMDGLWRDKEGKYYMYKMYPWGDNRQHNDDVNAKNHHYFDNEDGNQNNLDEEWRNGYNFCDESQSKKDTSKWFRRNYPDMDQSIGITAYTTADVSELFFCGFSWRTHISQDADKSRPHTHMISQLTPIPYSFDRHGSARNRKAVLGYPTHISELREGKRALRFKDPDYELYADYSGRIPDKYSASNRVGQYKNRIATSVEPYQPNGKTDR